MPVALSVDIREGSTTCVAAERFVISISSAVRIDQRDLAGISWE